MNASILVLSLASLAAAPQQDVLYDFFSTHCGPCQMMMPMVERLHAEGHPIVKINIDDRPDLAQRFGISVVPTFVLVVGGQVQQSISGMQEESTLRNMLAQIPRRAPRAPERPARSSRSLPVRLADDETKPKWNFSLPLPPFSSNSSKNTGMVQIDTPNAGRRSPTASGTVLADNTQPDSGVPERSDPSVASDRRQDLPMDSSVAGPDSVVRGAAPRYSNEPEASPDPASVSLLASSARIRVTDDGGVYFGSGVVIDGTAGKSIVLTCGHILRDVKPGSQIEVDLFGGKNYHTYRGSIVKFDLDADVGLVMLQTPSSVTASPVAAAENQVMRGQRLVSIGCSRGELPSIERLQVTMLNRYEGPDTIECKGVPVKGRSGGGLFTMNGQVVGVCTNADPTEGKGVYAGLKPIHKLLRAAGLEDLIPGSRRTRGRTVDVAAAPPTAPTEEPAPAKQELELAQMKQARVKHTAAEALGEEPTARAEAEAVPATEDAEVICIIRPIHHTGNSKVVIINRASRKFMKYLTGEAKDQVPTTPGAESSVTATGSDDPRGQQSVSTASTQTTSAWKPTSSAARLQTR
ncbi:MAG TPA: trypsin-like peptidase domain-containing protein [Planctomycetaceae bacterium]|jgi:thiol-disulfide isomerase/thioredoxin|nr:trypsin-like peptidase domain-containing protein [Planctomycetaceae bacterium]